MGSNKNLDPLQKAAKFSKKINLPQMKIVTDFFFGLVDILFFFRPLFG